MKKLVLISLNVILSLVNTTVYSSTFTYKKNEVQIQNDNIEMSKTPLYFKLYSTKTDNLALLDKSDDSWQGSRMFCEDDFTYLPDWSIYSVKPRSIAGLDFSDTELTFGENNTLQRVMFYKLVLTENEQNNIYNKLTKYLDQNYTRIHTPPLHVRYMNVNEIIKEDRYGDYIGWVNQDTVTYKTNDGYVHINKVLSGPVKPHTFIRPSTNGLYKEYANLSGGLPKWIDDSPEYRTVKLRYISDSFSEMIKEQCESL